MNIRVLVVATNWNIWLSSAQKCCKSAPDLSRKSLTVCMACRASPCLGARAAESMIWSSSSSSLSLCDVSPESFFCKICAQISSSVSSPWHSSDTYILFEVHLISSHWGDSEPPLQLRLLVCLTNSVFAKPFVIDSFFISLHATLSYYPHVTGLYH